MTSNLHSYDPWRICYPTSPRMSMKIITMSVNEGVKKVPSFLIQKTVPIQWGWLSSALTSCLSFTINPLHFLSHSAVIQWFPSSQNQHFWRIRLLDHCTMPLCYRLRMLRMGCAHLPIDHAHDSYHMHGISLAPLIVLLRWPSWVSYKALPNKYKK